MREEDVDLLLAPLPSGRHGLSREEVVWSQRMRLLRAVIEVAGREGYAATTVSAVIAQASVSRKTFYELFADREDCFVAAYELLTTRAVRRLEATFAGAAPWAERVQDGLACALDTLAQHPHEARVMVVEVLAAGPRALERRDRFVEALVRLLAEGCEHAPGGAAVPASTPTAVVGALSELIAGQVRCGAADQLPAMLPDLLYCALAPFLGPGAAAEAAAGGREPLAVASRDV
ncbi:MAG TPA: TetR/AcrR family transcriptional regulator [Conexibacter sp.]|nr:TetR/AcrR family transcriptional regulator [Conexibacter sp.]